MRAPAGVHVLGLATHIGFVGFHDLIRAAHRFHFQDTHCFAQAMAHEPSCLKRDAKRAVKLVAGNALLAAAHQKRRLKPDMQFDVAGLENGVLADGELAAAMIAFVQADHRLAFGMLRARLGPLRGKLIDPVYSAAMRTGRAVRPNDGFQFGKRRRLVDEVGFVEDACHDRHRVDGVILPLALGLSSIILP